ncbi:UrcA family protein [Pseudoteredinibacter isoporae]|uniref:UrcA family protein n=1 Tax=Pseudoteredinibacter isoporae TaxID=570281 RepID=UPI00310A7461
MNSNSKKITLVSATVMALFIASSAQAIVGKSVSEKIVSYSDLNLHKMEDQKALQHRLRTAADKVCEVSESMSSRSVSRIAQSKRCSKDAVDAAMKKVKLATR